MVKLLGIQQSNMAPFIIAIVHFTSLSTSQQNTTQATVKGPRSSIVSLLCGGARLATILTETFIEGSRHTMRQNEPLKLGQGPTINPVQLMNGRIWGLWTLHLSSPLRVRCRKNYVSIGVHIAMNNTAVKYDWTTSPQSSRPVGSLWAYISKLKLRASIVLPRHSESPIKRPQIQSFALGPLEDVTVNVNGLGEYSQTLSRFLTVVINTFPNETIALVEKSVRNFMQSYLVSPRGPLPLS